VFFTRPEKAQLDKWRSWLLGDEPLPISSITENSVSDSHKKVEATIETKANDNHQMGLF
jgi:hypothetical protein